MIVPIFLFSWCLVFLCTITSCVLGINFRDDVLEVKSQYWNLFHSLEESNISTYNIVKGLRYRLDDARSLSQVASFQQCLAGLFEYFHGLKEKRRWALTS